MVDLIESFSPLSTLFSSTNHRRHSKVPSKQVSLPVIVTIVDGVPLPDRATIPQNDKRWIGRCPGDSLRQLSNSHAAYTIHRKAICHELTQFYPAGTTETSTLMRTKPSLPQQHQKKKKKNENKEPLKEIAGTATTVPSLASASTGDAQDSRLLHTLSKHAPVTTERLRLTQYNVNNSKKNIPSWQKYWSSTHTRRRRRESNDSSFTSYRPQQPLLATACFTTLHNASLESGHDNILPAHRSSVVSHCSATTKFSSSRIFDDQSSFVQDHNSSPLISSLISPLPAENVPPMEPSKRTEEKVFTPTQSKHSFLEIKKPSVMTTKLFKMPLPSKQPHIDKSSKPDKSKDKVGKPSVESQSSTSALKTKQSASTSTKSHRVQVKKEHPLSRVVDTAPKSKNKRINWEEPYVGIRCDPPTPPSSPSPFVWPVDSDPEEDEALSEQHSRKDI